MNSSTDALPSEPAEAPRDTAPQQLLGGITVIDLTRALAGPHCTTLLGDLGADVIKVEAIRGGDPSRSWPPFEGDHSLYHDGTNRNKRSLSLDLYSDAGKSILDRLLTNADALVENFKPGTLAKMGLSPNRLQELNPRLVVASISGYGEKGPLHERPGLDQILQAVTGITSVTGPTGSTGYRVGLSVVDLTSGMIAAIGVLAALLARERGGAPKRVSTSLFEAALSLSSYQGQSALSLGANPVPLGNEHPTIAPYGAYSTQTEAIVLAVTTEAHWLKFSECAGMPELLIDPRFKTPRDRSTHREALNGLLTERLIEEPADVWIERLNKNGIPCGAILNYGQVLSHAHTAALNMIHTVTRADGTPLSTLRGPLSVDGEPTAIHHAPPCLGEDGLDILTQLDYSPTQIADFVRSGSVEFPTLQNARS